MDRLAKHSTGPALEMESLSGLASNEQQAVSREQPILRRASRDLARLSFAQRRLWFLHSLEAHNSSYNIARAFRIAGDLDVRILLQAIEAIADRQESLRTTISASSLSGASSEGPVQIIAKSKHVELPVIDISQLPESMREREAKRLVTEEAERPFDLATGPLARISLLRAGDQEHILALTIHNVIADERSVEIFFKELAQLYEAFSKGEASPLAGLAIQYADFAEWQAQWLQTEALERLLSYWKRQLDNAPGLLELPTDKPRPAMQSFRGAKQAITLSESLTDRLKALSEREGVTLYVTLLAAYQILLSRHSGQQDIVIGLPVAGRDRAEVKQVIGPFANALALRADLSGALSFREVLRRAREAVLGAYAHQDLPFEKLVEHLQPERTLSRHPLFQVSFQLDGAARKALELAGSSISDFEFDRKTTLLDLTLRVSEKADGLFCSFEYNTDLFEAATITRMMGHFQTLLEAIATANPEQHHSYLPMLTEAEKYQLQAGWNDTATDYPKDLCVHKLLEEQAVRRPGATAVIFNEQQLTYNEVNLRANQLAGYLRGLGVGPDVLVGVCVERGLEMVVALLGVLKAGGAYVPLDPTYPKDRLSFMLEDAAVPVLLTERRLAEQLPQHSARLVCLDSDWQAISQESEGNPASHPTPQNLAYVIYTSGSTGKPKGVQITHRAVVNLLSSMRREPGLSDQDLLLSVTTLSFDIAALELYLPLIAGARLLIVSREVAADGAQLLERLSGSDATVMQATPATWRLLLEAGWSGSDKLKILCGGEALSRELANELLARSASVWNMYGPTESTIWSAACKMELEEGAVRIGRPIANTQVYILDTNLEPVPVGVAGELYIGGDGLARGYLNRPELTAEKFIPDRFGKQAGARLYKTGDLCLWTSSGEVEFLGRIDHQVKIRGYRVEVGEVEAVLRQHASVSEAVVVAGEDERRDLRLIGYVVARQDQAPGVDELRNHLRQKLPDFMLPSAFVMLKQMPLTPNGKVDRRALPAPEPVRPELEATFLAPRSRLEYQLAKVWETVLAIKPIGIKNNFFEMGGHSLLAVRLFAQIENRFGKRLPLATLFRAPTVEQMAQVLHEQIWSSSWSSLVAIQPGGTRPPLFCIHAAGANVLIYRPIIRYIESGQPVYALQAQGLDGKKAPFTRIEDMAAYYVREIRALQPEGPYLLLGASLGGLIAFEMAVQLQAQGHEISFLAMFDTYCPIKTFSTRMRAHLGHLKEMGFQIYFLNLGQAVKDRVKKKNSKSFDNFQMNSKSGSEITGELDADDPLENTVRALLEAERNYLPLGKIYRGRITYFFAEDRKGIKPYEDNYMLWEKMATGGLELHEVPGDHLTMREEPHAAALADRLNACLRGLS